MTQQIFIVIGQVCTRGPDQGVTTISSRVIPVSSYLSSFHDPAFYHSFTVLTSYFFISSDQNSLPCSTDSISPLPAVITHTVGDSVNSIHDGFGKSGNRDCQRGMAS